MTTKQKFDYDEYLKGFRAACAQHGIDPAQGTTRYQLVNLVVDRRRARRTTTARQVRRHHWWQNHDLWLSCPPYRSETEQKALWHIFWQAYHGVAVGVCQQRRMRRGALTLRMLHQGEK